MALPVDSIKKCPTGSAVGLLQLDADLREVDAVDCNAVYSEFVDVEGVPWSLCVQKDVEKGWDALYLWHDNQNVSAFWSIEVRGIIRIVNRTTPTDTISHELSMKFNANRRVSSPVRVNRKKLLKHSGFLVNDCIRVEAEFTIVDMEGFPKRPSIDFTMAENPCFDVCLVVEGSKLYAGKQILAAHSPFFHSMFFDDSTECEKKEIELKDVTKDEFVVLLRLVYAGMVAADLMMYEIRDKNVVCLLKLADRFGVQSLREKCESHLMSDVCEMEKIELYKLADTHRLPYVQDDVLQSLKTVEEILELKNLDVYSELSAEAHASMLRRIDQIKEPASCGRKPTKSSSSSESAPSHSEKNKTRNGQNNKATKATTEKK